MDELKYSSLDEWESIKEQNKKRQAADSEAAKVLRETHGQILKFLNELLSRVGDFQTTVNALEQNPLFNLRDYGEYLNNVTKLNIVSTSSQAFIVPKITGEQKAIFQKRKEAALNWAKFRTDMMRNFPSRLNTLRQGLDVLHSRNLPTSEKMNSLLAQYNTAFSQLENYKNLETLESSIATIRATINHTTQIIGSL